MLEADSWAWRGRHALLFHVDHQLHELQELLVFQLVGPLVVLHNPLHPTGLLMPDLEVRLPCMGTAEIHFLIAHLLERELTELGHRIGISSSSQLGKALGEAHGQDARFDQRSRMHCGLLI